MDLLVNGMPNHRLQSIGINHRGVVDARDNDGGCLEVTGDAAVLKEAPNQPSLSVDPSPRVRVQGGVSERTCFKACGTVGCLDDIMIQDWPGSGMPVDGSVLEVTHAPHLIECFLFVGDGKTEVDETNLARSWTTERIVMCVDLSVGFVCPCGQRKVDSSKLESLCEGFKCAGGIYWLNVTRRRAQQGRDLRLSRLLSDRFAGKVPRSTSSNSSPKGPRCCHLSPP